MQHRTIAITLFNNVEELDFCGPWEVFSYLRQLEPTACDVFTVPEHGGEVRCAKGLRVIADHSFATAPRADVLIIPGGNGRKTEVNTPRMIDFIRSHAAEGELTASVCTGAFLLQR